MVSDKIKALFKFIEYLHSSIDKFNQYNDLIKELEQLDKERNQLNPRKNYKDKQQYDKVQAKIESKWKTLQGNTADKIKAKARELNICNFDEAPIYSFNGIYAEIHQFKENFNNEDLPEIFKRKRQYIEYRNSTHKTYLSLQIFFDDLDEITKSLFDYFKDTEKNEFETFETKAMPVNSIAEAIKGFQQGQTKFTLPNSVFFNPSQSQQLQNEALPPQQNETKTDKLKAELGKYGFFELPKVKQLSEPNKQSLVELISTNGLPYSIAMFEYLGFLKHIENEHFKTKYKLNREVANWFNSDKDGRAVKGNISSLSDYSTENKSKYTAHTHKETVKADYQKLK